MLPWLLALPLIANPGAALGPAWSPPDSFTPRIAALPAERPDAGTPFFYALLTDELFGSNADHAPPAGPSMRHPEIVGAYAINIGSAPWAGTLRLEIVEAGIVVERAVASLAPFATAVVQFTGYLDLDATQVTSRATAWEGAILQDSYEKIGSYQREWPGVFPIGVFIRDLDRLAVVPDWLPFTPFAVSFLHTAILGNTHIQVCTGAACEDSFGNFFCCFFRWTNAAYAGVGHTCVRSHSDLLGPNAWHAAGANSGWDSEQCFDANGPPDLPGPAPGG